MPKNCTEKSLNFVQKDVLKFFEVWISFKLIFIFGEGIKKGGGG